MSDTSQSLGANAPPVPPAAKPERVVNAKVRMDKTRSFATVHGERSPGDPHAQIHFFQDSLPFSADGVLLPNLIDKSDEKLQALAKRMQQRANALLEKRIERGEDEDVKPNDPDEGIVRLDYWLRGERKYLWPEVSNRIGAVYKKRVNSIKDAVEFLVTDQRLVPRDDVSREFKKHLEQD